jgi:YidC/Oxa1 family membrane protein insertase
LLHVLATNPIQPLINAFEAVIIFFHDSIGLQWGWAIVLLTILVRACLLPLTLKQFKSMQAMAAHGPEIKKLQARFKDDKERLNQEMMKFYRENKINPFASCLPMVAQLPVFLSLYYMLRTDLRYDICPAINPESVQNPTACGPTPDSGFLFIPDLTGKATGGVLIALIVLYVGSQLFSTLLMSTTTDKTQRMLFIALPFFFVIFVIRFPAGLLVYWITTNVWTIVQQVIVRKRLGPLRPPGSDDGGGLKLGELLRGGGATASTAGGGVSSGNDGGNTRTRPRARASSGEREKQPAARPAAPPPAPPRRKKKRSGRRR